MQTNNIKDIFSEGLMDIKSKIHTIRGEQVMLDSDLAELYGVETKVINQATRRNIKRFPEDFMFMLTEEEVGLMVSQSVIPSKMSLGGSMPYAFTEEGVANLANVLKRFMGFTKARLPDLIHKLYILFYILSSYDIGRNLTKAG